MKWINRNHVRTVLGAWAFVVVMAWFALGQTVFSATTWLDPDDHRSRGNPTAPVALVEYSDFTCGYCKKFFRETWPLIKAQYVDTGKVRFVYRDYPRADSGPGLQAAIAARCAGDQGQYWPMHDRLLSGAMRLGKAGLEGHAAALGIHAATFTQCVQEGRYQEAIFQDRAEGQRWGFRGTPGFVLVRTENGVIDLQRNPPMGLPGAFPFEVFQEEIERLLQQSR